MPGLARWIVLTGVLGLAACQAAPAESGKSLADAVAKYNARQIEDAEAIADKYIVSNGSGPEIDEAYYIRGLCRYSRDSRPLAALDLKQALAKTSRPELKTKAHRALGDIEFDAEDWAAAQADYDAALAGADLSAATTGLIDYRMGVALQAQGKWNDAKAWLTKAIAANPDPVTREHAVARMDATHFSLQFGAYHDAGNARDMVTQLQAAGITATVDSELREGQFLYLVRTGSYPTWTQAAAARDQLIGKFPLVAIIP